MLDAEVLDEFEFRIVMLQGLLEPSEDEDLLMIPAMLVEARIRWRPGKTIVRIQDNSLVPVVAPVADGPTERPRVVRGAVELAGRAGRCQCRRTLTRAGVLGG
jgi:hypothetical protein